MADPRNLGNELAELFGLPKRATSMSLYCDWQSDGICYLTVEQIAEPLTIDEQGELRKIITQYRLSKINEEDSDGNPTRED